MRGLDRLRRQRGRTHPHLKPPPQGTILTDQAARRLLASAMDTSCNVWAYAAASATPADPPADEIVCTETDAGGMAVVWVRHHRSFTGATGHLAAATGTGTEDYLPLLRRWQDAVFELADLIEPHAAQESEQAWFAELQVAHLRWAGSYGLTAALSGSAGHTIGDTVRDAIEHHQISGLHHDLGQIHPDDAARIAYSTTQGPAALIPPGWSTTGWDYDRPRTHPILTGLRTQPHPASVRTGPPSPPQGPPG
ncbi:hypothetical protein AGRA3207_007403 [Actinomadura graeca]|uniref:Uncharacterized protein n=1 Tax=Actinomadura graeca TaxID=2750812 RepID=A0ABX8R7V8_9ACTN|nr:hypothetical protein [Actinomadura graeca]QXJ25842.1 hypothetical protein AGRA3207_007403 [Actinomadura graeca]